MGGVYSYDCSFGHVPNVELMKFIAMATFGAYLSTCPELDPLSLDLNVYHKAFLLYSFLRTGESLNPEYYCGEECACLPSSRQMSTAPLFGVTSPGSVMLMPSLVPSRPF